MAIATKTLDLVLLTGAGVLKCRLNDPFGRAEVVARDVPGENIRTVVQDPFNPRHLYAASVTDVYASEDAGETWTWLPAGGVDYREIWTLAVHPSRPNEVYVGTMPAMVYVSENGGRSFRELPGFRNAPEYGKWTFPVPPHRPNVRCICLDARVPDDVLVGIEEGGVTRSRDGGRTFEDVSGPPSDEVYPKAIDPEYRQRPAPGKAVDGRVYRDVHWLLRDPSSLERYYATTGFGLYLTDDAGQSWTRCEYGMERGYAVPMAIHPDKPDRLFLGAGMYGPPAWLGWRGARTGPFNSPRSSLDRTKETGGAHATILRSDDRAASWQKLSNGLPHENPYMVSGVSINPTDPDNVFVSYTEGTLYASSDGGESWRQILDGVERLYGVTVLAS
jgi:photosystem II stability/assembly factor-like uncharacterized protein